VMGWPPEVGKVLSSSERRAHAALDAALRVEHPQGFLLAHVPLPRLVRVTGRRSYKEWLGRTGLLSADFVLCDAHSKPVAVVLLEQAQASERAHRRHERLRRVVEAAGIRVLDWAEDWQPDMKTLRAALFSAAAPAQTPAH
jgi:Protein of unknown function (DUF2726)